MTYAISVIISIQQKAHLIRVNNSINILNVAFRVVDDCAKFVSLCMIATLSYSVVHMFVYQTTFNMNRYMLIIVFLVLTPILSYVIATIVIYSVESTRASAFGV